MMDSTLAAEPTENAQATHPAEPMDRIDPADPIDRIDPDEPMDRMEPDDPMLRIDPSEPVDDDLSRMLRMTAFCQGRPGPGRSGRAVSAQPDRWTAASSDSGCARR
jgi:hypothetical protein